MTYDIGTLSAARLWRYQPDFAAGVNLTRSFRTDIITSRNDKEQRRALRDIPRLTQSYRTNPAGDDLQSAKHYLRAWQNQPSAVPDFSRWSRTTADSNSGTAALTLASPPPWIAGERLAVLCAADGTMELVEITSVAGPTINLAANLANTWLSGSVIRPVIHGLLDGQMRGSRITRGRHSIEVRVRAYPGGEPPEDEGTASDTFNGYEVFTAEPDFVSQPPIEYLFPVEQVDFGFGRTAQFRPIEFAQQLVECEFSGLSVTAAQGIEQVFLRAKGRRGAFYRPTCEKDMTLAADTSAVAHFDAVGSNLFDDFGNVDYVANPTAIEIVESNGTRTRKLITGITLNGSNSRVAFSGAISLATATTARISWMPLVRFASDEMSTLWQSPLSATIRASFQSVRR